MKRAITILICYLIAILFLSCNSTEPPLPPVDKINSTISLTSEWQEMNAIEVKWNRAERDTQLLFTYRLTREDLSGNKYSKEFILTSDETTFIDNNGGNGLSEGTNYDYKIEAIYNNKLKDTSNTIHIRTLSASSHNIVWEIDTLGQPGDFINDIWGLDENNVWAIGAVNMTEGITAIVKWNGMKWNYHSWPEGGAKGIWGFSANDIWTVGDYSNRGFIGHFNGTRWTEYRSEYFLANGDTVYILYSIWGSSINDIWAVGDRGTIIHWDGNQWRKVQSPTNLILYDIWGTSVDNVYAIHISLNQLSTLIRFDGTNWIELTNQLPSGDRDFASIWFDKGGTGYLVGNNVVYYDGVVFNRIDINQDRFLFRVRGRNSTDVFTVGQNGRVYHFNGIDWMSYPELYNDSPGMELRGVFVTETTVFAVGIINSGSIIYRGVR